VMFATVVCRFGQLRRQNRVATNYVTRKSLEARLFDKSEIANRQSTRNFPPRVESQNHTTNLAMVIAVCGPATGVSTLTAIFVANGARGSAVRFTDMFYLAYGRSVRDRPCHHGTRSHARSSLDLGMSTKFFTNEAGRTLIEKIEGIFQHKNIHFLDVLVGYFRASGYFRIRPFIQRSRKIRILVGINIDRLVQEAWDKGLQFGANLNATRDEFLDELKLSIQKSAYDRAIEEGMIGLVDDITSGKVEIRVHPSQTIHAKVYIFREETKHPHGYGAVITGSSNLTDAGLERNFEFNVELRDDHDIDFATETFNRLWEEGVPVGPEHVQDIKRQTFLNDSFTPHDLFIKFLAEYFGPAIHYDPSVLEDLPSGFKKLGVIVTVVVVVHRGVGEWDKGRSKHAKMDIMAGSVCAPVGTHTASSRSSVE